MLQQDSLYTYTDTTATIDTAAHVWTRPRTPYEVLSRLPRNATPAQQDSAVQAWFPAADISYKDHIDTLQLPGYAMADAKEQQVKRQYRESYFAKGSPLRYGVGRDRLGVAGDPVPYSLRTDDTMTILLLSCFVLFVVSVNHTRRFISRQLKEFFFEAHSSDVEYETSGESLFQLFLVVQTCLLLSVMSFFYATEYVADTFILADDLMLVGIFFIMFVGYFLGKTLLYALVNGIFFGGNKTLQWMRSFSLLSSVEGVLLFPGVLLQLYFDLSEENATFYYVFALLLVKFLTFYKCWSIFFRQNSFSLQIILYFCALEITPLLAVGGGLLMVTNQLKVIF